MCSQPSRGWCGAAACDISPRLHEHPANGDEGCAKYQETDVPADRRAEIVADVVDTQDLVIDDPFSEIEGAPADQEAAEVSAPRRREFTPLPRPGSRNRARQDRDPGPDVEEAVCKCVVLQPDDGARWVAALVREHVVPLKNLMEQDAIHEATDTNAHQEGG
jgi:hypothetical protein